MRKDKVKKTIVVLSAGIKQDQDGKWVSADLIERKKFAGAPGGKIRVIAASYMYKDNPESFIIASGGRGFGKNIAGVKHSGLAEILKKELIDSGVPADKIIEEKKSNTTHQQLSELQKIAVGKEIKNLVIISNRYHLPRVRAMIKYGPGLNILKKMLNGSSVKLKSAEDVLMKYRPEKWEKIINQAYQSREMMARINIEAKGVKQIKKGTYNF